MRKFFCALIILLTACLTGCLSQKTATDVNQIPTEVATIDKTADKSKAEAPAPQAQAGKDYILAADDLSNLQLSDPTLPI